jgi:hypothetical protein
MLQSYHAMPCVALHWKSLNSIHGKGNDKNKQWINLGLAWDRTQHFSFQATRFSKYYPEINSCLILTLFLFRQLHS